MQHAQKILIIAVVATLAGYAALLNRVSGLEDNLGATIPTVVSVFETSLASNVTSSATSMTLVSGEDKEGNSLSGTIGFVLDEGGSNEEFVVCSASGTALTSCSRGISVTNPASTSASLQKAHRRGANVKITNYPQLAILSRILNGTDSIPNIVFYPSNQDFSVASSSVIVDKNYVDTTVLAGCANIDESVKGCGELATVAEINAGTGLGSTGARLLINPSYLASSSFGLNIPTSDEKAALTTFEQAGIVGTTGKFPRFTLTASAQGDLFYQNSSGEFVNLGIGSNKEVLVASQSVPIWDNPGVATTSFAAESLSANGDLGSFTLQGGLLGTARAVRIKQYISELTVDDAGSGTFEIALNYGGSVCATTGANDVATDKLSGESGVVVAEIWANESTSAQFCTIHISTTSQDADGGFGPSGTGTLTKDSTSNQAVSVTYTQVNSSITATIDGFTVELIY